LNYTRKFHFCEMDFNTGELISQPKP